MQRAGGSLPPLTMCMPANVIDSPFPGTNFSIVKSMAKDVKGFSPEMDPDRGCGFGVIFRQFQGVF